MAAARRHLIILFHKTIILKLFSTNIIHTFSVFVCLCILCICFLCLLFIDLARYKIMSVWNLLGKSFNFFFYFYPKKKDNGGGHGSHNWQYEKIMGYSHKKRAHLLLFLYFNYCFCMKYVTGRPAFYFRDF